MKNISKDLLKGKIEGLSPRGLPHIVEFSSNKIETKTEDGIWTIAESEEREIEDMLIIPLLANLQSKYNIYRNVNAYTMKAFCSKTKDKGAIKSNRNTFQVTIQFYHLEK